MLLFTQCFPCLDSRSHWPNVQSLYSHVITWVDHFERELAGPVASPAFIRISVTEKSYHHPFVLHVTSDQIHITWKEFPDAQETHTERRQMLTPLLLWAGIQSNLEAHCWTCFLSPAFPSPWRKDNPRDGEGGREEKAGKTNRRSLNVFSQNARFTFSNFWEINENMCPHKVEQVSL